MSRTVLVTGGAGFIGSHLVDALLVRGDRVRVLDNFSTGRRANLAGQPVELIAGDVAEFERVAAAVDGCDLVLHQAALVSVPQSLAEPERNHASNVTGFFNVLEAMRQSGVRRLVYASSAAVYGNRPGLPKREHDPAQPLTPYAAAKLMNEQYAAAYTAAYGVEAVGLRYMNVFGPRQDPSSPYSGVLSIFGRAAIARRPVTVFGDGEQTRDFVFVDDVVQAILLAAAAPFDPARAIINIGRGEQTSLNQILALLGQLGGGSMRVTYAEERPGDIHHSVADITRARVLLGFAPQVSVEDGLRRTLAWFAEEAPA